MVNNSPTDLMERIAVAPLKVTIATAVVRNAEVGRLMQFA
ncbi:hypothetical protein GBP346_A3091 [Burkholderia pseudomallei MSHR346]|nr:hypothetical protein GBP346_A3091 [Burkholderia pseudomallei MSHR346]